jgi:hypothetical protein
MPINPLGVEESEISSQRIRKSSTMNINGIPEETVCLMISQETRYGSEKSSQRYLW